LARLRRPLPWVADAASFCGGRDGYKGFGCVCAGSSIISKPAPAASRDRPIPPLRPTSTPKSHCYPPAAARIPKSPRRQYCRPNIPLHSQPNIPDPENCCCNIIRPSHLIAPSQAQSSPSTAKYDSNPRLRLVLAPTHPGSSGVCLARPACLAFSRVRAPIQTFQARNNPSQLGLPSPFPSFFLIRKSPPSSSRNSAPPIPPTNALMSPNHDLSTHGCY
jgi:hypothetical protein